jgi:ribosomal protein L35
MKLKTVKSAKKRIVRITVNGLVIHRKLSAQHRVKGKSKRVRSDARKTVAFNKADAKKIRKMVPYL